MNRTEVLELIRSNLKKTLKEPKRDFLEVGEDTDLVESEILDSLDSIGFFFDLEKLVDVKFSDEQLNDEGLYRVSNLIDYIIS